MKEYWKQRLYVHLCWPIHNCYPQLLKQPRLKTVCKEKSTGIGSRCRAAWSSLVDSCHVGTPFVARWSVWVFEPVKQSNGDLAVAKQDMSVYNPFIILIIGTCWKINVPQRALEKKCAWRKTHHSKWKLRKKPRHRELHCLYYKACAIKKDILCWQLLLGQFLVTLSTKQSVKTVFNDRF